MAASGIGIRRGEITERVFAVVGYALLSISVFAAGIPALIAVCFAYVWRDRSSPLIRRHFNARSYLLDRRPADADRHGPRRRRGLCGGGHAAVVSVSDTWTTFGIDVRRVADFNGDKGLQVATPVVVLFVCALISWALGALAVPGAHRRGDRACPIERDGQDRCADPPTAPNA